MRRTFLFAAGSLSLFALALTLQAESPSTKASNNPAEQAIKAKIEAETKAYYDNNLSGLKTGWVEDDRATRILVSRFGYDRIVGWNKIADWYTQSLAQPRDWTPGGFTNTDYRITTTDNMAWVEYDQTTKINANGKEITDRSHEIRTLVKENGDWKFLSMETIGQGSYDNSFEGLQSSLSAVGSGFLALGKTDQAIELLKLNTQFYPQSANAYDSLAEAYRKAGKKDLAIQSYQKSLEIDSQNKNAEKMLTQLKAE